MSAVAEIAKVAPNAVKAVDRENDFGEVIQQEIVAVEFHLDRVEHVHRVAFVRTN